MFRKLFSPDSDLMIVMTWITDVIFLSLFWILGCILGITVGASTAALYDAVFYAFRKRSKHSWGRFWSAYWKNLKASLLPTILTLAAGFGTGYLLIQLWNNAVNNGNWLVLAVGAVIGVVAMGMLSLLLPMLSRFESSFGQLVANTVRLAMAHLPRTVILGLLNALTIFLCGWLIIPLFILPAITALLSTVLIEPMFKPYLPDDFYEILSES